MPSAYTKGFVMRAGPDSALGRFRGGLRSDQDGSGARAGCNRSGASAAPGSAVEAAVPALRRLVLPPLMALLGEWAATRAGAPVPVAGGVRHEWDGAGGTGHRVAPTQPLPGAAGQVQPAECGGLAIYQLGRLMRVLYLSGNCFARLPDALLSLRGLSLGSNRLHNLTSF
ncbi:UNVERIFIED_CONTAM: hypothetical protein K2H54_015565 [Gekko kuhli]